jgi:hypothetical protein
MNILAAATALVGNCSLQYLSFYQADVPAQNGSINLVLSDNYTTIQLAAAMRPPALVLYGESAINLPPPPSSVTSTPCADAFGILFNLRPYVNGSYHGYTLPANYETTWQAAWTSTIQVGAVRPHTGDACKRKCHRQLHPFRPSHRAAARSIWRDCGVLVGRRGVLEWRDVCQLDPSHAVAT